MKAEAEIKYITPVFKKGEYDPFTEATLQFERAAGYLDIEPWIYQRLKYPERDSILL